MERGFLEYNSNKLYILYTFFFFSVSHFPSYTKISHFKLLIHFKTHLTVTRKKGVVGLQLSLWGRIPSVFGESCKQVSRLCISHPWNQKANSLGVVLFDGPNSLGHAYIASRFSVSKWLQRQ